MGKSDPVQEQNEHKLAELLRAQQWYVDRIDQINRGLRKGNSIALKDRLTELEAEIETLTARIAAGPPPANTPPPDGTDG